VKEAASRTVHGIVRVIRSAVRKHAARILVLALHAVQISPASIPGM
jgi:hypothetical protein